MAEAILIKKGGSSTSLGKGTAAGSFSYDASYSVENESGGNWNMKLLSSGTLTALTDSVIDIFLVGGGGSGDMYDDGTIDEGAGGAGGYTQTYTRYKVAAGKTYSIVIGAGGIYSHGGKAGGATTAFGITAGGGEGAGGWAGGNGGSGGGAAGGAGGSDGSRGDDGRKRGGKGQGWTTRAFGESTGTLYAGGGGGNGKAGGAGGGGTPTEPNGAPNTGGGGYGGVTKSGEARGTGGSGIVIIRNTRY